MSNKIMKPKKTDNSPKVQQRDKIKDILTIRQPNFTPKQQEFINLALSKESKLIFVKGPAGSAKSYLSTYVGLTLINQKKISDIIYVRSAVESSDSKLGYLPGDANEKMLYYGMPFFDKLDEFISQAEIQKLIKDERVSVFPPNFARGMSWNVKLITIDEAQNISEKEMITLITRIGQYSKCLVLADPRQSDIPSSKQGGFEKMAKIFNNEESRANGIHFFEFGNEDIMRSGLTKYIIEKIEEAEKT